MLFTPLDIFFTCAHSISGWIGIIGNLALLAALKFRSPPTWKFVPFKEVTMSVYLGPCILISGFFCHAYTKHGEDDSVLCARLPADAIMTFFTNDPSDAVRVALRQLHPEHEQFEEYVVEGHVDIKPHVLARLLQAYIILPIVPLMVLVFFVRSKVIGKLKAKEDVMTTRTKEMHKSLVKVLTLQASLPIFFLASVISFILVKRQICESAFLEYTIFLYVSFMPTIAPYITLYNVTPFRNEEYLYRQKNVSIRVYTNSKRKVRMVLSFGLLGTGSHAMIVMIAMLATCATRKQECAVQTFAARIALGVWRDIRVAMALAT
ncbi:hypothetical protein PRIPAC_81765 [Pristionchus pacificus]|uniref:G protein-coupled receptor n=1 Tax=Pristionchus pacificus TaxID=54126 RepID=A0A2A6CJK0_PRIPA|nr:hypothetical protein PRIPAC_81765 [Pristionchus pacificus]|eukprot:PDM78404.1 G protein-coupled receptor [Pristionchus pacificus]